MSYIQHHFNVEVAQKFGTNVAIFLDQMVFWIQKNIANNHNFHDEAYWTYNSVDAYTTIFPYWTARQMRKVIQDCQKYGLVNIGNYNEKKYDRKQWYSLTEYAAKLLNISILPKSKMDLTKKENAFDRKVKPIAVTNAVTNTITKRESTARKKRVPLSNDYIPSKGMDSMSQDVANRCNTTSDKLLFKFKNLMKSNGKTSLDWDAEYGIFLQREKPQFSGTPAATQSRNVNISSNSYGGMRDFTQERIDRENGITHGSEISGDNTGRTGMHQAAKHLFQEHVMGGMSQSNSR